VTEGVSGSNRTVYDDSRVSYGGWVAGGLVIVGVVLVGVAFWFMHHP
jgi:hypothetical protein